MYNINDIIGQKLFCKKTGITLTVVPITHKYKEHIALEIPLKERDTFLKAYSNFIHPVSYNYRENSLLIKSDQYETKGYRIEKGKCVLMFTFDNFKKYNLISMSSIEYFTYLISKELI
jgi:hypothetical protein